MTTAVLGTLVAGVPACADDAQFAGTVMGAGVGGWLGGGFVKGGGRFPATVAGGVIGNQLARPLYQPFYVAPGYAYESYDIFPSQGFYAAPYQPTYVAPPAPPPVTYIDDTSGQYCRQFSQRVRIDNRMQEAYGTACLQPDGSWHVVQ